MSFRTSFRNMINKNTTFECKKTNIDMQDLLKCGEIFVSKDKKLLLNCDFCDENFIDLDQFCNHLLAEHSFIFVENKLEVHQNNSFATNNPNIITDLFNISNSSRENYLLEDNESNPIDGKANNSLSSENVSNLNQEGKEENENLVIENNFKELRKIENNISETASENIEEKNDKSQKIPRGYWRCDICQLILKRGQERAIHERKHKRLICETCGKGFTSKNRFFDHIRTHTGEKPFKCRFCPKVFSSHSSMKSHDKTHIGYKPFKCDYCDHYFEKKYNKQIHERNIHKKNSTEEQEEKPFDFICKLCNKSFKCSDYLTAHLKRHTESMKSAPKPFECNFCPSTFVSNSNRNAHERLCHKGDYNYKCCFCGKGFLKLNKKRKHEEMHTRVENPYKCDLCECAYAHPEGLRKHKVKKHAKDAPYKCQICQLEFESTTLFREHCKQHNIEENLYGCNDCEARFDSQYRLTRHINKMHSKNSLKENKNIKNDLVNGNELDR